MWQGAAVAGLVALCSAYVLWALLLPASARARLIDTALRWPLPVKVKRRLQEQASRANGCGCSGCDKPGLNREPSAEQPVRIVRRAGR